ncbi:MAG: nucleoside triphosphate pyrophosphohydrolase [candidate division WOR-3 bacterium]|nr:nucleoside triphosphate pyrophosphohydrolase [candidate division WOR-3 bacterium]
MFEEYLKLIKKLRQECPWDKKQTLASSRAYILDEAYELEEAIRERNYEKISEEIGDLIYTTLFVCRILEEKKKVSLRKIEKKTIQKLILRHPHIFGNVKVKNAREVLTNWENIKRKEKDEPMLNRIPKSLPALKRAQLIQERVGRVGFDWKNKEDVYKKVMEEIKELKSALKSKKRLKIAEELGDLLFALVNFARHLGLDAEYCLSQANNKFIQRFHRLEKEFKSKNKNLPDVSLIEMDAVWEKIKQNQVLKKN